MLVRQRDGKPGNKSSSIRHVEIIPPLNLEFFGTGSVASGKTVSPLKWELDVACAAAWGLDRTETTNLLDCPCRARDGQRKTQVEIDRSRPSVSRH